VFISPWVTAPGLVRQYQELKEGLWSELEMETGCIKGCWKVIEESQTRQVSGGLVLCPQGDTVYTDNPKLRGGCYRVWTNFSGEWMADKAPCRA